MAHAHEKYWSWCKDCTARSFRAMWMSKWLQQRQKKGPRSAPPLAGHESRLDKRVLITWHLCHSRIVSLTPAVLICSSCMPTRSIWKMLSFPMHLIARWNIFSATWSLLLAHWSLVTYISPTHGAGDTCYWPMLLVVVSHATKTYAPPMAFLRGKTTPGRPRFAV